MTAVSHRTFRYKHSHMSHDPDLEWLAHDVASARRRVEEMAERAAAEVRRVASVSPEHAIDRETLGRILSLARCDVEETEELGADDGGAEGLLLPRRGGFTILVDPRPAGGWRVHGHERVPAARRRLRFRILHELGHTFFFDYRQADRPSRLRPADGAEERFCDAFAAAVLLPPWAIRAMPFSAAAALELASVFDVSLPVLARSIATYHPEVRNVSLLVESRHGPRVRWSSDLSSAQTALDLRVLQSRDTFISCRMRPMNWARRGDQALFMERVSAAL